MSDEIIKTQPPWCEYRWPGSCLGGYEDHQCFELVNHGGKHRCSCYARKSSEPPARVMKP